ncbi:MAG: chemotaxis protein CheW [Oculatellaceae cyanobacterium bins.114]|nr:chemotaxis protein CheW [Oculatellaceae cyanobacterium bins.114]
MSDTLIALTSQPTTQPQETCKAIVFAIANHLLALPVSAIFKVVQYSPALSHSIHTKELILFYQQPLTLLDLHPVLTQPSDTPQERSPTECLIIAQAQQGLYAIPVDQPPTLQELAFSSIHPLPTHYSKAIAHIASHFALLYQHDAAPKILLLDLYQASHQE